jgi:hypothetical protein
MSVSPTRDALIVALDFEGELEFITANWFAIIIIQNLMHNRCPESRAFSPGGHAPCSFQHRYFKSRT